MGFAPKKVPRAMEVAMVEEGGRGEGRREREGVESTFQTSDVTGGKGEGGRSRGSMEARGKGYVRRE